MLKLNNKSFNTTLGYMKKWVVVKQLTKENSYGCFQIRVVSTGSIWYVCKKYLTNVSVSIPKDTSETTIQEDTIIPVVFTAIGSYYKIAMESPAFFDDSFERFTLAKWDFLRQVSHWDSKTGCVGMKVIGTSTEEHDGKIIDICSADLVVAVK
jgi:hypothetical protein